MNGIRVLCDTNTLLYLLGNNELVADFLMGKQVNISAITELELFGKQDMNEEEISIIEELVESCEVGVQGAG
jgi:predicted nucleic acid-binding protein